MLLHRHGWSHFYHEFSELQSGLNKINRDEWQDLEQSIRNKKIEHARSLLIELHEHLLNIQKEFNKEDNIMAKIHHIIKQEYLVKKVISDMPLTDYENSLKSEFDNLGRVYREAIHHTVDYINSLNNDQDMGYHERFKKMTMDMILALNEIKHYSQKLGKYFSEVLPHIEKYKEWVEKETQSADWAERNIKSWITSNLE
jgi:hypothetical protein